MKRIKRNKDKKFKEKGYTMQGKADYICAWAKSFTFY